MRDLVWIDGAFGEGGGQIIRTSVSLAALTGKAVEIANIRARRSKPGLQAQHLTAVRGFKNWFASGAGVDAHLADQLALPCALIPAESRWTTPQITDHLRTVLWAAQQFLPIEYTLEPRADGSGLVMVRGVRL